MVGTCLLALLYISLCYSIESRWPHMKHSPLTPAAQFELPDAALSWITLPSIPRGRYQLYAGVPLKSIIKQLVKQLVNQK